MCYSTDLFCCIVKSLLKKFPLKSHESKNILNEWIHLATSLGLWSCTAFTVWFKDTSAGWHSLPKQRLKPRSPTAVEGQTLCSVFFQTYIQGQSNQMESRPGPAANRGWASVAEMRPGPLNTSWTQVPAHLSCRCHLWLQTWQINTNGIGNTPWILLLKITLR